MRDLEIRGAGNLLGESQSGHIAAVGYDLYCQMVTEAVGEMKGEPVKEPSEVKLDVPTDAYLPKDYVEKEELRLEAYRRLAAVTTQSEVDDIRTEWEDRYGPVPAAGRGAARRRRPARRVPPTRACASCGPVAPGPPGADRAEDQRGDAPAPAEPRRVLQGRPAAARRADQARHGTGRVPRRLPARARPAAGRLTSMGRSRHRLANVAAVSRRLVAVVVALVAALTLSSCGSSVKGDAVASVGDAELTRDDLDTMLNNRVVQDILTGEIDGDTATVEQTDSVIRLWIWLEAAHAAGVADLDDEATAKALLDQQGGDYTTAFDESTGATRELLTRFLTASSLVNAKTLTSEQLSGAAQAADVSVDSRYGFWDAERSNVFPFGKDLPPVDQLSS